MSKLNLDRDVVESCRKTAHKITQQVHEMVSRHSTVSIERAFLRVIGVNDTLEGLPLVNHIVDPMSPEMLSKGIAYWMGSAMVAHKSSLMGIALKIAKKQIRLNDLPDVPFPEIKTAIQGPLRSALRRIDQKAERRGHLAEQHWGGYATHKLVRVATHDDQKDTLAALDAVDHGADIIELGRSPGHSLLDYVPVETQIRWRHMRRALDQRGKRNNSYARLLINGTGLCLPERAILGAEEGADALLTDALYSILFRNIQSERAFVDQHFARLVIARTGMTNHTMEEHFLSLVDSYRNAHQAIVTHFLQEQWSKKAGLKDDHLILSHSFSADPGMEDGFLYELAHAQMIREIFPKALVQYVPQTKSLSDNIAFSDAVHTLSYLVGIMTQFNILKLSHLNIAEYLMKSARGLGTEIHWQANGKVIRRARSVLDNTFKFLNGIEKSGLSKTLSQGTYLGIARDGDQGKGGRGVFRKDKQYYNPLWEALEK
jgi:beta-lysine 5,6-aminomutase alpha subunit